METRSSSLDIEYLDYNLITHFKGYTTNDRVIAVKGQSIENLNRGNIQLALILKLPFHLSVGRSFLLCDEKINLYFKNSSLKNADTKVLALIKSPSITNKQFKHFFGNDGDYKYCTANLQDYLDPILEAINVFIDSYVDFSREKSRHHPNEHFELHPWIKNLIEWEIVMLCPKGFVFSESDLDTLFTLKIKEGYTLEICGHSRSSPGELKKDDIHEIAKIYHHRKGKIFYEMCFRAQCAYYSGSVKDALLLQVIALEGVHYALLKMHLTQKMKNLTAKEQENYISNYLREKGVYSLIPVTIFSVLAESERPDEKEVKLCLRGIEIRNSLVHLLQKQGRYRFKQYDEKEIRNSFIAVSKVYTCLRKRYEVLCNINTPESPENLS